MKCVDLTTEQQSELRHMGKGHSMFYTQFHKLRDMGLCWLDFTSNREILTPLGREILEQEPQLIDESEEASDDSK